MFPAVTLLFLVYYTVTSMTSPIAVYRNAYLDPNDTRYVLSDLLSISSVNACLCQCYSNKICFTVSYSKDNGRCTLFFRQLSQGQLPLLSTTANTSVYNLGNRSIGNLMVFNRTNETVFAIWNTTAGGNSSSATSGFTTGTFWPTESPQQVVDSNLTTCYTNHGACNYTSEAQAVTCGEKTGFYLTMLNGPVLLTGFRLGTTTSSITRDPLTLTIEGSNVNGSGLIRGSSWTLIYNGASGLMSDPGRSKFGLVQVLTSSPARFASYRLLVTSKRGFENSASYSEVQFLYT